jgi:hypothetical protein
LVIGWLIIAGIMAFIVGVAYLASKIDRDDSKSGDGTNGQGWTL